MKKILSILKYCNSQVDWQLVQRDAICTLFIPPLLYFCEQITTTSALFISEILVLLLLIITYLPEYLMNFWYCIEVKNYENTTKGMLDVFHKVLTERGWVRVPPTKMMYFQPSFGIITLLPHNGFLEITKFNYTDDKKHIPFPTSREGLEEILQNFKNQ